MAAGAIHASLEYFNNVTIDHFMVLILPLVIKFPTGQVCDWICILIFICTMLMLPSCFLL